jgi:hypothetical protein
VLREQCQQDSAKVSEALAAGGLAAAEAEHRGALQPGTVVKVVQTQQANTKITNKEGQIIVVHRVQCGEREPLRLHRACLV